MEHYAQNLQLHLSNYFSQSKHACRIELIKPPRLNFFQGVASVRLDYAMHKFNRYLVYQAAISAKAAQMKNQRTIFHITDPTYAHLGVGLPHRSQVVTVHDLILLKLKNRSLPVAPKHYPAASIRSFEFSLAQIRRASLVIAASHTTARELVNLAGIAPEKIRPVHLGLSPEFRPIHDQNYLAEIRRRYQLPGIFLLHVGHSRFYKNLETLLECLARLSQEFPDLHLVKVGANFTSTQQQQIERLGLKNKIIEVGKVPAADLPAIYNLAQLLVFPSLHEGFGWPPLEALACGTPVVASNAGALPEILGQATPLLDPCDVSGMVAAIRRLLGDNACRRHYIEAGLMQAAKFDWAETARKTAEVYLEVIELNQFF